MELKRAKEVLEDVAKERAACRAECIDFSYQFPAGSCEREALQRVAVRLEMRDPEGVTKA